MPSKRKTQVDTEAEHPAKRRTTRSTARDTALVVAGEKAAVGGSSVKTEATAPAETPKQSARRTASQGQEDSETTNLATNPFQPYPTSKVYRLVEPGPVLLVTTGSLADGTHNVMTVGFHMVVQHEAPPLLGISLGPWDASFAVLKRRRECVLAVPSVEMAGVVVDVGNCSADDEPEESDDDGDEDNEGGGGDKSKNKRKNKSKWERFGLEALPAEKVKAPLVGGPHVMANIECVVEDTALVGKYSMWVLRAVRAWQNTEKMATGKMFHHRGDGTFTVDGEVLDLQARMVKWKEYQD